MNDIFFQGFWRMDWGLGNPNKTAALIAILMVAVWLFSYFRSRLFWISLALFSALGICLVHTFSRGGLVAALCGLFPLLSCLRRPLPIKRIVGAVAAVWVIIGASIFLQAHERYTQGVGQEDRSISNRFVLWKAAPSMMVDAPTGWGLGQSGKAYTDWYQPLDRNESYRTLVNSHLTWLVEFGWPARFLYVFGWLAVLLLCWPTQQNRWLAVPLGIWIAFFTGAWFSSVAESIWIWIVPVLALIWVIVWRIRTRAWASSKAWIIPPALASAAIIAIILVAQPSSVSKVGNALVIGEGVPAKWIVVDPIVLGKNYPRPLREYLAKNPRLACGLVEEFGDLPHGAPTDVLVLTGQPERSRQIDETLQSVKSLTLLNPAFSPSGLALPKGANIRVVIGEFAQTSSHSDWRSITNVETLVGVGDFISDWPRIVFNPQG